MKLLESVPFLSPWHPLASRSVSVHLTAAVLVCIALAMTGYGLMARKRGHAQQVQNEVAALKRTMALPGLPAEPVSSPSTVEWPLRRSVDEVIQRAGLAAARSGVNIRSFSVSHQAASPAARGRVNLEVSASGSYAALKAWQADVLARFPALAVQNLRMQVAAGGAAALESQRTWVLYVGD